MATNLISNLVPGLDAAHRTLTLEDGSSGATAPANSILTLEGDGDRYLSFLTPNTASAGLKMVDPEGEDASWLWDHSNRQWVGNAGGTDTLFVKDGQIGIGVTPASGPMLHLQKSAVTGADYNADDLITLERSGSPNINLIGSTSGLPGLLFSDDSRARGSVRYNMALERLEFLTNGGTLAFDLRVDQKAVFAGDVVIKAGRDFVADANDNRLVISGGNANNAGANIVLRGGAASEVDTTVVRGGATELARFDSDGLTLAGSTALIATNNSVSGKASANQVAFGGVDLSAGNTIPSIDTEGTGIESAGSATIDRTIAVEINGTVRYLMASDTAAA